MESVASNLKKVIAHAIALDLLQKYGKRTARFNVALEVAKAFEDLSENNGGEDIIKLVKGFIEVGSVEAYIPLHLVREDGSVITEEQFMNESFEVEV